MSENKSTIGISIIFCLTFGIVCTLVGLIIIGISRLVILKNPFKFNIVLAFWVGLAPILFLKPPPKIDKQGIIIKDYDYTYTTPNKIELEKPPQCADIEAIWACGV